MDESKQDVARCGLCGEPMPPGEQMFKYHGYSGNCPKPPLPSKPQPSELTDRLRELAGDPGNPMPNSTIEAIEELQRLRKENATLRESCRLLFSMIPERSVPNNIYTEMPWLANESE